MEGERTFETSIPNKLIQLEKGGEVSLADFLAEYAGEFNRLVHLLYRRRYFDGCSDTNLLKREFLANHNVTARQYNAIKSTLDAMCTSSTECLNENLKSTAGRIKSIKKWLKEKEKERNNLKSQLQRKTASRKLAVDLKNLSFVIHNKKRRLLIQEQKLEMLLRRKEKEVPKICFGSGKMFHAQFSLEENGYRSHEEWLVDFRQRRAAQFFVLGSKDESYGNQSCQYNLETKQLKLRLTNRMAKKYGQTTIVITNVCFRYGQEKIIANSKCKQAISFRFIRRMRANGEARWHLQACLDILRSEPLPEISSSRKNGALGIDINAKHLAVTLTNSHGNFKDTWNITHVTANNSTEKTREQCFLAAARIVEIALQNRVPIVLEKLDFSAKKNQLREKGARYARMLSSFAYSSTKQAIKVEAAQAGIEVIDRNPAMTSIIGQFKYSLGYNMPVHNAAALVIARRGLGLSEHVSFHGTSQQVVKFRNETLDIVKGFKPWDHPWKKWRVLKTNAGTRLGSVNDSRRSSRRTPRSHSGP